VEHGLSGGLDPSWIGLAVALGCGLLIGLERERRKHRGPLRQAAGMRSFTLAALAGALAQTLAQPLLVAAGALAVLLLAGVAYARSRFGTLSQAPDADPGLTTELALFVTYLLGVLAVADPPMAAGAGVVVAALLAGREKLHRFATRALSEAELHDALLLAALALVLLPLLPATPLAWLGGLKPRSLIALLVLILLLQALGHVALRLAGPRFGLALAGLFSGFVSSTATVASMGALARRQPAQARSAAAAAMLSTAATWVQALVLLTALSPPAAGHLAGAAVAGMATAVGGALLLLRGQARGRPVPASAGGQAARPVPAPAGGQAARPVPAPAGGQAARPDDGPLRLREALLVAAALSVVTLAVSAAEQHLGHSGIYAAAALGALADAHSSVAALGSLHAAARIELATLGTGVLVAIGTNALLRSGVALVAGGTAYGARVALSLAASTTMACVVLLGMPG
jgi:uncharacterized membrane protein (DUF4010 family)